MSRVRRNYGFLFTTNNYSNDDVERCKALECRYIIIGFEVAPTTGTPHLQGYVHFGSAQQLARVISLLPAGSHIEVARGSAQQNRDYCAKSGQFWEHGSCPINAGEREKSRWEEARKKARIGAFKEIPADIELRCYSAIRAIYAEEMQMHKPPMLDDVCGEWHWGVAGAGKSYGLRLRYPDAFIKNLNKDWDGYVNQDAVIMDELTPSLARALASYIKLWSDRYAFNANIKYSVKFIRPKVFLITSNYSIEECFEEGDVEAIRRRFKVIHYPVRYQAQ